MNAIAARSLEKPLKSTYKFKFLYLALLLIYGHAVLHRPLEYYIPQGGKLLTFPVAVLLVCLLCAILFRTLVVGTLPGGVPIVFLLLFIISGFLSIVNMYLYFGTMDLSQFTTGFYKTILPVSLVFWTYILLQDVAQGFRLFGLIAWLNTSLATLGFITYLLGEKWAQYYLQLAQMEGLPLHFGGVLRMTSVLWNPLVFGVLMALSSIMAWNMILYQRKVRPIWVAMFALSTVGTLVSFTRTAWFMLLLGIVVSAIFAGKRFFLRFAAAIAIFTGAAVLVLNVPLRFGHYSNMSEAMLGHMEATFVHEDRRMIDLKVNLHRIVVNPIGYGLGTAGYAALPTRGLDSRVIFTHHVAADNNYLSMTLQVGIQGLVLFILAHGMVLYRLVRCRKWLNNSLSKAIAGTAVGWMVGMMTGALFLNVWEYNLVPHVVYSILGIALRSTAIERGIRSARLGHH